MGKKGFLGAIEITKLKGGKLSFEHIDHLGDSDTLPSSHRFKIEIGVDVEVSHLDEIQVSPSDQRDQPLILSPDR
jgi:hypothetical protein